MASSWPAAFDSTFPGWPYVDNTEYVLASHANAWVSSLQALETGIGYGSGSSANNPLYSVAYNTTYATITSRIAALETVAVALPPLDPSAGDIQPVGNTASAGNEGKAADAKHVHVGVTSVNGTSGPVTISLAMLEALFTAAGQILAGTGSGTGALLAPGAAGTLLTSGGTGQPLSWTAAGFASGDLKFTSNLNLADGVNWIQADGSTYARTGIYANLFAASTMTVSGSIASGTGIITGFSSTQISQMQIGTVIEWNNGAQTTTVTSLSPLTGTYTGALTGFALRAFPYGWTASGTFPVIDVRGRSAKGWGAVGTAGQPTTAMGQYGGVQTYSLTGAENGAHAHTGTTAGDGRPHAHASPGNVTGGGASVGDTFVLANPNTSNPQTTALSLASSPYFADYASFGLPGQPTTGPVDPSGFGSYDSSAPYTHTHTFTSNTSAASSAHQNESPFAGGMWLVKL